MNKLTKENIVFIDNYLKQAGIDHIDTKLEILDHVATGIEEQMKVSKQDFYDTFKDYMVAHKKDLLKWNENAMEKSKKLVFSRMFKYMYSIDALVVALLLFVVYRFFPNVISLEEVKYVPFIGTVAYFVVYLLLFYKVRKLAITFRLLILAALVYYSGAYTFLLILFPIMLYLFSDYNTGLKGVNLKVSKLLQIIVFSILFTPIVFFEAKLSQFELYNSISFFVHLFVTYVSFKTLISFKKDLQKKHKQIIMLTK